MSIVTLPLYCALSSSGEEMALTSPDVDIIDKCAQSLLGTIRKFLLEFESDDMQSFQILIPSGKAYSLFLKKAPTWIKSVFMLNEFVQT